MKSLNCLTQSAWSTITHGGTVFQTKCVQATAVGIVVAPAVSTTVRQPGGAQLKELTTGIDNLGTMHPMGWVKGRLLGTRRPHSSYPFVAGSEGLARDACEATYAKTRV